MKKFITFFFSSAFATLLLLVFAVAMAAATFIENDYGSLTARTAVYNAWWFEMVMVLLGLNFLGNIQKYKLYKKGKTPILLFHIAFVIILIGSGISRYTAYEGIMRIREGETSNTIISDKNYIQLHVIGASENILALKKEQYFSPLNNNHFSIETEYLGKDITITYDKFVPDAVPQIVDIEDKGEEIIEMVVSVGNGRETRFLKKGEIEKIGDHQHKISFQSNDSTAIDIFEEGGQLKLKPSHPIDFFSMETQLGGNLKVDSIQSLNFKTLYRSGDFSFVLMSYHPNAKIDLASQTNQIKNNDENIDDALLVNVTVGNTTEKMKLLYRHGFLPIAHTRTINNTKISLAYGAVPLKTPFSLKLNDFQLERYPGSTSPSAYSSEITVIDEGEDDFLYRIFMNNVLDYKGYRFFQASYDTDEQGTVLSVNHDKTGTLVTYLGYLLMGIGMFWTLFGKQSRFSMVQQKLKKLKSKKLISVIVVLLCTSLSAFAQDTPVDSLLLNQNIDKHHADLFGRLMVQDLDGRIKPMNTLASEFLRKISGKTSYKSDVITLDANQTFLAMHADPNAWTKIPLIKIDFKKGGTAYKDLKPNTYNLVAFNDLITPDGTYILKKQAEEANAKKPANRNEFDKEILKTDERFNILFNVFSGNYLKIFPKRDDDTNTWYSYTHDFSDFPEEDAQFAAGIMPMYFNDIAKARVSNNWDEAENKIAYIKKYQDVLAKAIIPSAKRVEAELWYNQINLFFWLFQVYWTMGLVLLVLAIVKIFNQNKKVTLAFNVLTLVVFIAFLLNAGNIILRWYVAQHAPWSNGYEMLTFVAWALLFFGLLFYKKSDFALPLATLFSGTLLFVSYLDWLSPEITNLMPVLKSYWLKIHVATIISSYAPLALSALLGVMALILMIIKNDKNKTEINIRIKELTYINELAMIIGLFLLAIGTFLGGVWANESWGRYWAWDPKETWALISIIVYAVVLHLHLIPKLKSKYTLNVASIFAFYAIIMTSFGVNYYLSGLHSYATGDPVPIPKFIYVLTAILVVLSVLAYYKNHRRSSVQ